MNSLSSVENSTGTVIAAEPSERICAPGYVRGHRLTPSSVVLSWDEPYSTCSLCPDAIGYEVVIEGLTAKTVTRPPCEITGLTPAAEYIVYVTAIAAGNNVSRPSPYRLFKFVPVRPSQPGIPEVSDVTFSSASLKWAPSTDNGGNIRYRVYLNDHLVGQVEQPVFNLSHLRTSVDYRVKVVAVNEGGTSEPACVSFKTLLRPPANLKLKHNAGTCRLSWAPMFLKFPNHEVTINGKSFTAGPLGLNFSLAEVSPGDVPHHFKCEITAKLGEQTSETTLFETVLYDVEPPTMPGKPVATNITHRSVDLEWTPSTDNSGFVQYRVVINGWILEVIEETQSHIGNLQSGAKYLIFVRAEDKDGNLSGATEPLLVETTGPAYNDGTPLDFASVDPLTSTTARLYWRYTPPAWAGAVIVINGKIHSVVPYVNATILEDLIPGFIYTIELFPLLKAFNSNPKAITYEAKDITPPSVPGNLTVMELAPDSVTLTWKESTDDVGVLEYVIYNNNVYFDSTPLTQYTAVDLVPDTYSFEVRAVDFSGNASEPASIPVDILGIPSSAPTNFRISPGLIPSLCWDAPSDMEDVIRYDIVLTGPGKEGLSFETSNRFLKLDLLVLNRYEVSITALNAKGRSAPLISEFTR